MRPPIPHPILGQLVPEPKTQTLLAFRQFPYLRPFWHDEPKRRLRRLRPQQREWVENWRDHAVELAHACRDGDVYAAAQSCGVFKLRVPVANDGVPSATQEEAIRFFAANEEQVCRRITDALGRYYQIAREELAIDGYDFDDYPEDPSLAELGQMFSFESFEIVRCSADGVAPIWLSGEASWDLEHGLSIVVYRDQVVLIGAYEEATDFLLRSNPHGNFGIWDQCRTDAERSMRERFVEGYLRGDFEG
jgi:Domain of unknown function (DUF6985)